MNKTDKTAVTDPRTVAGDYPEREQRLELALIKLIKSRFASYTEALKWANEYRNNPKVDIALLQAIDAVENN